MGFADCMVAPQQQVLLRVTCRQPSPAAWLSRWPSSTWPPWREVGRATACPDHRNHAGPLGLLAIPNAGGARPSSSDGGAVALGGAAWRAAAASAPSRFTWDKVDLRKVDFGKRSVNKILVVAPPSEIPLAAQVGRWLHHLLHRPGLRPSRHDPTDADTFHLRRQQLRLPMVARHARPEALDLLRSGLFDPNLVLSGTFPLEAIAGAMVLQLSTTSVTPENGHGQPRLPWR